MTKLLNNPNYIQNFEKVALVSRPAWSSEIIGLSNSNNENKYLSGKLDPHARIHLFTWRQGERAGISNLSSLMNVDFQDGWDLVIVVAPRDSPQQLPDFRHFYELFDIPGQFVSESLQSVTHSFGIRNGKEGTSTSWMHLLSTLPGKEICSPSQWIRSGFVLTSTSTPVEERRTVTLTCFEPPPAFWRSLNVLFGSPDLHDILADPYLLFALIFEAWYELVDENAWNVLDLARDLEKAAFEHAASLETPQIQPSGVRYSHIHAVAKEALHLIEAVDGAVRSLESTIQAHSRMSKSNPTIWGTTHDALHHRREVFASTRLRLSSIDQRLKNVINLAFNVSNLRDSGVMREDSRVMKTLSVVAMIFLPISTVSSIFGTQFFGTTPSPDGSTVSTHVTSQFWIFWVIIIPLTIGLLLGWVFWIRRYHWNARRGEQVSEDIDTDVEIGTPTGSIAGNC